MTLAQSLVHEQKKKNSRSDCVGHTSCPLGCETWASVPAYGSQFVSNLKPKGWFGLSCLPTYDVFKDISGRCTMTVLIQRPQIYILFIYFFQLSATISVPWWQWFLTRFGKKTAINCSMIVSTKCWIVEMHVFMFIFYLLLFIYFVVSFPTVGNTVHDHNCVRQEQPHCFLFGLSGGGRECGSSFLSALVRRPY